MTHDSDDSKKPQLNNPDAPITNEELHLGVAGNAGRLDRHGWATHLSIVAVAASIHGFVPAAFGVAIPATFGVLHFMDSIAFVIDSDSRARWLLNKFTAQDRSLDDIQRTHREQLSAKGAVPDGGQEVTSDE